MDGSDVARFIARPKVLNAPLEWKERRTAHLSITGFVDGDAGALNVVVVKTQRRRWMFRLMFGDTYVLCWHFTPAGEPRRHRNGRGRPPGVSGKDRSPIHEHLWVPGMGTQCSRPLEGLDEADHATAFKAYCRRANIGPVDAYRPPPEPHAGFIS